MRILHALSQTELTGSEVYAFELATHQHKMGHEVLVVSDSLHKPFPGGRLILPLSTSSFWTRMGNILKLRSYLVEAQVDVIHCHSRGACRNLYWASRFLGIPMITTVHGFQHSSFSKKTFDIYGDYVLAVCEKIFEQQVQDLRRDPDAIEVLRNPVSYKPSVPKKEELPPTVLLMGRNSGPKGENLKSLVTSQAWEWCRQIPDLKVLLVLSGASQHEIDSLKQSLPVNTQVYGHLENPQKAILESNLVIGAGRIAVEALLAGRSVLGLGESDYFGPVTTESFKDGIQNNFGDVGPQFNLTSKWEVLTQDLVRYFKNLGQHSASEGFSKDFVEDYKVPKALVQEYYSFEKVNDRVLEIYKSERIRKHLGWLPILMYHKVVDQELSGPHRIFVLKDTFEKHLKTLKSRGFYFLSFNELSDYWNDRKPLKDLPKKSVLLTFDDGYINNLKNAVPLLKQYGARGTLFLLADHSVTTNHWDFVDPEESKNSDRDLAEKASKASEPPEGLMTLSQKQSLDPSVIEVGSHGLRHERLPAKTDEEILSELRTSKVILEHDLKCKISVFAYAFGDIDQRLPALAEQAGYQFAVNTDRGPVEWTRNPRSLFRVSIFPEDNAWSVWKKTSKWYRKYYRYKRGI